MPADDPRQRCGPWAQIGASAVVFEPYEPRVVPVTDDIADTARHLGTRMDRFGVEHAQSGQFRAVGGAVAVSHQLIAAADGQQRRAVAEVGQDAVGVLGRETLAGELLLAVLASADHVQIGALVQALAPLQSCDERRNPSPGAAAFQAGHVAAVSV